MNRKKVYKRPETRKAYFKRKSLENWWEHPQWYDRGLQENHRKGDSSATNS